MHALNVHEANVADSVGARPTLSQLGWDEYPRLEVVFADSAYQGPLEDWTADHLGLWLVVVRKLPEQHTFVVLPKRWIVERTFAWLMKCRRLVRDYEATISSSMAWIRLAMIGLMLRRLHPR
jgi:transposase